MPISAILFVLIFITGCAAALFADATYGIYLYVFEYFLNPPGRWWGQQLPELRYAFMIGAITLVSYFFRSRRYINNRIFDSPQTKWLALICIIVVCTYPIAVNSREHQNFMILIMKYFLLYVLIIKLIDTPGKFEKILAIFLAGQFYLGWIARETGRDSGGRLENLGGADCRDANGAAALMIVAIPIVLNYLITGKRWQKICALPALAFILNAVILINSRGAFIALIVSTTYYLLLTMKSPSFPKFSKVKVLLVAVAGALVFMYLADPVFLNRMATIESTEAEARKGYTGRERIEFWFATFDMLKDHPAGAGAMGYDYLSSQYLPEDWLNPKTRTRAVHSLYFQVLSEYGYHGLAVFMIFVLSNFRYLRKLRTYLEQKKMYGPYYTSIALEAGFLSLLVSGIFISTFYMEINYWMAAFFAAYGNIYFKQLKQMDENVIKEELLEQGFPKAASRRNYT